MAAVEACSTSIPALVVPMISTNSIATALSGYAYPDVDRKLWRRFDANPRDASALLA